MPNAQQRAGHRVGVGEEQLAEDEGGGRPVEEEVVPLGRGADQAREDDLHDPVPGPGGWTPDAWVWVDMCVVSFHAAVQPPSIRNELPVTESVPGPQRKPTMSATSAGSTSRFTGVRGEQDVVEDLVLGDPVGAGLVGDLSLDQRGADVAGADACCW